MLMCAVSWPVLYGSSVAGAHLEMIQLRKIIKQIFQRLSRQEQLKVTTKMFGYQV